MTAPTPERRIILLAGPTASGKSAHALRLARALDGVIINADSMQIYAGLPILTARPTPAEEAQADHRLYGVAAAHEDWSAARWREAVAGVLASLADGRTAIIVGGTGLYFRALTHGLAEMPPIPDEIRAPLRAEADLSALHRRLAAVDREAAERLHPNDRARITRALEIVLATGRTQLWWQQQAAQVQLVDAARCERYVIAPDRAVLHDRINQRFDGMIAAGVLDEVRAVMALGLPERTGIMKAIGLRPLMAHLCGDMPLAEAVDRAKAETRQYAKRQETWFRNQMPGWTRLQS